MASIRFKRGTRAQLEAAAAANGLAAGEPYLITDEDRFALGTAADAYVVGPRMAELELQRVHDIGAVGAELVVDLSLGPVQQAALTQTCNVMLPAVAPGVARLVRLYLVGDFAITVNEQVPYHTGVAANVHQSSGYTTVVDPGWGWGGGELIGKYFVVTGGAGAGGAGIIEMSTTDGFVVPASALTELMATGDAYVIYDLPPVPFAWLHGEAPELDSPNKLLVFSGTSAGWVGDGGVYG